jgi:hypothetical protein
MWWSCTATTNVGWLDLASCPGTGRRITDLRAQRAAPLIGLRLEAEDRVRFALGLDRYYLPYSDSDAELIDTLFL